MAGKAIAGSDQDDLLYASAGSDTINGLNGNDTVLYAGGSSGYSLVYSSQYDLWVVRDLVNADPADGTDYLISVEFLQFDNAHADLSSDAAQAVLNISYGEGHHSRRVYDRTGAQSWTQYENVYDFASNLKSQAGSYSAGGSWLAGWDTDNTQDWKSYTANYDAQGRQTLQVGNYNDGRHWVSTWDVDNTGAWSVSTDIYNADWSEVLERHVNYDDGTYSIQFFDTANQQNWSSYTNFFDANWNLARQNGNYDNGNTWLGEWDFAGQSWNYRTTNYNPAGQSLNQVQNSDDGTYTVTTWDVANSQPWDYIVQKYASNWSSLWSEVHTGNQVTSTSFAGGQFLSGGSGNDTFIGTHFSSGGTIYTGNNTGNNTMVGGAGDDVYSIMTLFGATQMDTVIENPNEGIDTVKVYIPWTPGIFANVIYLMPSNIENAEWEGMRGRIVGNELDNYIKSNLIFKWVTANFSATSTSLAGGAGNDTLDAGSDLAYMYGGPGDDVYYTMLSLGGGTNVNELPNEGVDTMNVYAYDGTSGSNFVLPENVENVNVIGAGGFPSLIAGNSLNNKITGNSNGNFFMGSEGNDTMTGGGGKDSFGLYANSGIDVITDYTPGGNDDHLYFGLGFNGGIFATPDDALAAAIQVGADVVIAYLGTNAVTLQNVSLASLTTNDFFVF